MAVPLSRFASGRDNNFNLIRFLAAGFVLWSHAFPLSGTWNEPFEGFSGFSLGRLGVDIFFVISGFLVTGSLVSKTNLRSFLRARVLRIFPALVASAMGVAFVLGPLVTRLPLGEYFARPAPYLYAARNATTWPWGPQYTLPGVFEHLPVPNVVNGSLWSLPWELSMYLMLTVLGVAFVARRATADLRGLRRTILGIAAFSTLGFVLIEASDVPVPSLVNEGFRLLSLFAVAAACFAFRERLWLSLRAFAVAAGLLFAAFALGHALMLFYALCLPYLVLYLAYVPAGPVRLYNRLGDYSYGTYLWAFPVEQWLMQRWPETSQLGLAALAAPLTVVIAIASWHGVEKPMLARKARPVRDGRDTLPRRVATP